MAETLEFPAVGDRGSGGRLYRVGARALPYPLRQGYGIKLYNKHSGKLQFFSRIATPALQFV